MLRYSKNTSLSNMCRTRTHPLIIASVHNYICKHVVLWVLKIKHKTSKKVHNCNYRWQNLHNLLNVLYYQWVFWVGNRFQSRSVTTIRTWSDIPVCPWEIQDIDGADAGYDGRVQVNDCPVMQHDRAIRPATRHHRLGGT